MLVARGYDAAVRYNSTTSTVRELLLKAIDMCEKEGITCLGGIDKWACAPVTRARPPHIAPCHTHAAQSHCLGPSAARPCPPHIRRQLVRPHGPQHVCLCKCVREVQARPAANGLEALATAAGSGVALLREYVIQTYKVWPARALSPYPSPGPHCVFCRLGRRSRASCSTPATRPRGSSSTTCS